MTRLRPSRRTALLTVILLGVFGGAAMAYFSAAGAGTASAGVGTVAPPSSVTATATPGSGTVPITWTAPSTGISPQGYYVRRNVSGGGTAPACATSATSLTTSTSCNDLAVADGTYTYTVIAKYHSFTASSSASNSVTVVNDNTPPSVTVEQKAGQADPTNTLPMLWTVTFSEPVTGFDAGDLTRGGTSSGGTVAVSGSGASYEISLSGTPTDGTTSFTIAAAGAQDLAGNDSTASTSSDNSVTHDAVAPSTTIATSPASPDGSGAWFQRSSVSFTLAATDATSGVADRFYTLDGGASQSYGGAVTVGGQGVHTVTYFSTDAAGNAESASSATIKLDGVAPATTFATSPASPDGSNGWFKRSSVSFALAASDATSGVASSSYTLDGGAVQSYGGAVTVGGQGVHTVTYFSTDAAGNAETAGSATIKLDNVAPANALALTGKTGGGSFMSGNTVFYQGATLGSFKIQNTLTDATSGAASSAFGVLGGTATGWSHTTPDTQTSPSGGPFASNAFGWSAGASSSPTEVVTGADAAGNATTAPALTFTNDSTAPAGGTIGYTNGFLAALSVPVTLTDGSDGGSGIDPAARVVQRDQVAPTATGACGTFPGTFATPVTLAGGADTTVLTNTCYQYRYSVADRVGNQVPYTSASVAKVDATAPTPSSVVAANGTSLGQINKGSTDDTLTFTYADAFGVTPGSVVTGWTGAAAIDVSVTFTDGGAANDSITVPGLGTVDLGGTAWLTQTSIKPEPLSMPANNRFVVTISANPGGNASSVAASNFTWSTSAGTAKDGAGNGASGSVTSTNQRF